LGLRLKTQGYNVKTSGLKNGGGGGIRTHGIVADTPDFKSGALDQLDHPSAEMSDLAKDAVEINPIVL
jgi:hypothetical protein